MQGEEQAEGGPVQLSASEIAARPAAVPDGDRVEDGPMLPTPHLSGLLTVLPPLDLPAVERGMQQFLDELEEMGQSLAHPRDGTGLFLWIGAGATAAAACEIARRQLRRPTGGSAVEVNQWLLASG